MSNRNEKNQIARDALSKMNLTKYDNDPEKEDFVNDRDLANQLGIGTGTVWNARQALIKQQIDEDYDIVYAWRWSGDKIYAKIGISKMSKLDSRLRKTYHPTDDPVLIGVMPCRTRERAEDEEWSFLNDGFLKRSRPDREWVIIDEVFNEMIDEAFISDPSELKKMFGNDIKTEKS